MTRIWAFEDWDLPDRVARDGWTIGRLEAGVWHDEGRIQLRAAFAKKRYYGRSAPDYLASPPTPSEPAAHNAGPQTRAPTAITPVDRRAGSPQSSRSRRILSRNDFRPLSA